MPLEQGAQHHESAFGGQQFWRREVELFKNEFREAIEGKNLQPSEAGNFCAFQQLAFELERGLFRREQNERRSVGRFRQCGAHFGQTAESFSAASGTEQKARLHGGSFHAKVQRRKEINLTAANAKNAQTIFQFVTGNRRWLEQSKGFCLRVVRARAG